MGRPTREQASGTDIAGPPAELKSDVKAIAPDVLRHRVLRTYEAEAEEVTSDEIVSRVLEAIPAP